MASDTIFFGHESVNRVLFLREDPAFLSQAALHPLTRVLLLNRNAPVAFAQDEDILVAVNPRLSEVLQRWRDDEEAASVDIRTDKPTIVFLGLRDESVGWKRAGSHIAYKDRYFGVPYFAVNYDLATSEYTLVVEACGGEPKVLSDRRDVFRLSNWSASLASHAMMYMDWLHKNRFCPGCGSAVIPIHGGTKLQCTNKAMEGDRPACGAQRIKVNNVSFPRTDAVIITAVVSADRSKVLLGRSKRWADVPGMLRMFLCIAGFMEPGESVEAAVRRECWEETGVVGSSVRIEVTQPWPYPANLMVGCVCEVEWNGENEKVLLDHDAELAEARWFDVAELKRLLEGDVGGDVSLPFAGSVAHTLIDMVVRGKSKSVL